MLILHGYCDRENAEKIALRNYELYPGYLFAKTNNAHFCLEAGKSDEIEKIFEGKYDLKSLYPKREIFHISEFLAFIGVWVVFFS